MVVQMAYQIPEEMIEEVRKSNDIVDVIGEYVQLKNKVKTLLVSVHSMVRRHLLFP